MAQTYLTKTSPTAGNRTKGTISVWIKRSGLSANQWIYSDYYSSDNLVGKQVIGVCNFPTKNIAGITSEVLILGAIEKDGKVVLVHPSQKTDNGLDVA